MQDVKGKSAAPVVPPDNDKQSDVEVLPVETLESQRKGRRFAVSQRCGKARSRLRYIETSDPSGGCRFL